MDEAEDDVLTHISFLKDQSQQIHSTNRWNDYLLATRRGKHPCLAQHRSRLTSFHIASLPFACVAVIVYCGRFRTGTYSESCLLPTAYCLLPTAYCLLPTAYCLLPTAYVQRAI